MSQQELANRLGTSQQQISRLESPDYESHSLSMLRRVATELDAEVLITFKPGRSRRQNMIAESRGKYMPQRKMAK
ncbi:MAG: XRE family transcriptional regulator [Gammaproteobacteria bacterium]|nr:MAG: XRE family transcriptional regulator [Gammaproteobacteria bacterium]